MAKEINETNKAANQIYNDVASKIRSGATGDDLVNEIAEGLNSNNPVDVANARSVAKAFTAQLTPLLFDQYVREIEYSGFYGKIVKRFFYKEVIVGNGTQIVQPLPVGPTNTTTPINLNNFVPTAQTPKFVDVWSLNFFTNTSTPTNQTFSSQGFCVESELTIPETEYLAYFREGNPEKYFAQLRKQVEETVILTVYDKIGNMLATNFNPQTVINGTATNSFECWTKEILPAISEMLIPNTKYNYSVSTKYFGEAKMENVHIYMSSKTWTNIKTYLMSQNYNVELFKNKMLTDENVDVLGFKLNLGNGTQAITLQSTQYLDDDTVIVGDDNLIRWIRQYQGTASQFFASNFTTYYKHYEVMAIDFLPWGKCFKYTNTNLNNNPN